MANRYDELSDRARWFLNNFDEIDLADICAAQEASNQKREAAIARVVALADEYPVDIDTALIHAALDEAAPAPAAAETATTTRVFAALHRSAEEDVSRVTARYERWVTAGPPPGTSRWWDERLTELHDAIQPPAHNDGPSIREAADADRRWWSGQKEGQ